jgi:hypothetical protein
MTLDNYQPYEIPSDDAVLLRRFSINLDVKGGQQQVLQTFIGIRKNFLKKLVNIRQMLCRRNG